MGSPSTRAASRSLIEVVAGASLRSWTFVQRNSPIP